jgi:hypothetical protein
MVLSRLVRAIKHPSLIVAKIWLTVVDPKGALRRLWLKFPFGSYELRMDWDIFQKPAYAYGIYHAAELAKKLGHDRLSVIEFGVASGHGLLIMEQRAAEVEQIFGIKIEVYGFDTGSGLPPASDYRDLPNVWSYGQFEMDEPKLRQKLSRAHLVIGNVLETVKQFSAMNPAPVGFVSFDMDYYSSTIAGMKLFEGQNKLFLPRILCYFDDIVGTNHYVGELLAIKDFNLANKMKKIDAIHGFGRTRNVSSVWNDALMTLHMFEHPHYSVHVGDIPHFPG